MKIKPIRQNAAPRQAMLMGEPHMLAYINEAERQMLKRAGGAEAPGPGGIPTYGFWADTFGNGNSFSQSVANALTPNDGKSYVGGVLTKDKDEFTFADEVLSGNPSDFAPPQAGGKEDANNDGVKDYDDFIQTYNAQFDSAQNDPTGQSTAGGFIQSDGKIGTVNAAGDVVISNPPNISGGGKKNTQDGVAEDDVAEDDFYNIPIFVRDPYAGGIGAFGYSPELMQFESQQGAGQVPYYMAAARNAQNPNISPAFQYAAENYDILGGEQRTAPRPIEMMSAAERAQILGINNNNFNTPNYSLSEQNEFDYYKNMFGGGGSPGKGGGGVGPGLGAVLDDQISPDIIERYKYIISDLLGGNMQSDTTTTPTDTSTGTSTTTPSSSAQAYDLLQDAINAGTEEEKNVLLDQVGSKLEAGVREAGGDIVRPEPPNVLPPSASFKFKYGTPSVDNFGRRQYTGTMLVEMPDGTISTYRAGTHSSRQKLQDDFNRMMAGVNASLRDQVQTVNQNYGTQSVDVSPTDVTMSGGTLSGPGTFTVRDRSTGQNQIVDDRGIRQGDPFYGSVNRNDPNYDPMLDSIVEPVYGINQPPLSSMGMMNTAPQQRSQFNSMGELMDFQNQNPTMNLMGEYQRLSELE